MEFSEETKKQILEGLLKIIARIADKEYQKRVWIRGEGPECDDFDETVNSLLDPADAVLEDYKNFNISKHQYELFKKFQDNFKIFAPEHDYPQEFIDDPEWDRIVEMAGEVLKAFNFQKK
ncbi:MAG TPA: hypothetical protein VLG76_01270 [Rhabdochlamydiaceae bacterium]|nr:hypothetical protein [Rhabdochlamydiaceae bacterium]